MWRLVLLFHFGRCQFRPKRDTGYKQMDINSWSESDTSSMLKRWKELLTEIWKHMERGVAHKIAPRHNTPICTYCKRANQTQFGKLYVQTNLPLFPSSSSSTCLGVGTWLLDLYQHTVKCTLKPRHLKAGKHTPLEDSVAPYPYISFPPNNILQNNSSSLPLPSSSVLSLSLSLASCFTHGCKWKTVLLNPDAGSNVTLKFFQPPLLVFFLFQA